MLNLTLDLVSLLQNVHIVKQQQDQIRNACFANNVLKQPMQSVQIQSISVFSQKYHISGHVTTAFIHLLPFYKAELNISSLSNTHDGSLLSETDTEPTDLHFDITE